MGLCLPHRGAGAGREPRKGVASRLQPRGSSFRDTSESLGVNPSSAYGTLHAQDRTWVSSMRSLWSRLSGLSWVTSSVWADFFFFEPITAKRKIKKPITAKVLGHGDNGSNVSDRQYRGKSGVSKAKPTLKPGSHLVPCPQSLAAVGKAGEGDS